MGVRRAYPDLGKCLYFDLGYGTHSVLYELLNKRINWIWYVNQPEPELKVIAYIVTRCISISYINLGKKGKVLESLVCLNMYIFILNFHF